MRVARVWMFVWPCMHVRVDHVQVCVCVCLCVCVLSSHCLRGWCWAPLFNESSGKKVYELRELNFIGEMGLHVGLHIAEDTRSSATVVARTPMKVLAWPRSKLIDILEHNPTVAQAVVAATRCVHIVQLSIPCVGADIGRWCRGTPFVTASWLPCCCVMCACQR